MSDYFFDWEVRNENGVVVKWANNIVYAHSDVDKADVFSNAKDNLKESMELPDDYHVRCVTFSKI